MNIKIILTFFILSLSSISVAYSQTMALTWQKHFQGTGDNSDRFNQIIPDGNGNYIGVGYSVREGNYRDFITVKFDAAGNLVWERTLNRTLSRNEEATHVAQDNLGNIYVAGYTDGDLTQDDILLVKYNSSGVYQWDTTWNSPASLDDLPTDIAIDGNGNIFITGTAEPDTVTGSEDYITLKFSPSGGILWQVQYSRIGVTSGKDEAAALALDSNGDCYVTGRSSNGTDDDMLTFKYDGNSGAVLFTQFYNGGSGDDRGVDIAVDNAGNIIVTGRSDNGNNHDFRTLKYTNTGGIIWSKFYNGPSNQNDRPVKLFIDSADNVHVTGESDVDNSSLIDYDFATIKYNSAGTLLWARLEGSNAENDSPSDIIVDSNGDVFVTGKADMNTNLLITNNDYMTVKYNSAGTKQWTKFHAGTRTGGSDIASSIQLDVSGNCYVAGGSENNITQKDATVVKYDSNGNVSWVWNHNGKGDFSESGRSIVIDANEFAYVGGYSYREGRERDIFLIKLESDGDTVCSFIYDGTQNEDDELSAIALDANGFVYATGYTKTIDQKSDMFTMKWNPNTCDTVWTRIYNHSSNQSDRGQSLVVDASGNVYVTGRSDSNPVDTTDNLDVVTIKYDTNGNQIWLQRYNGPGNLRDEPSRILLDNSGNVLVCGRVEKVNDDDFLLIKYASSNGNEVWPVASMYNGPFANDDRALDMTIDANDNIFVCGYSQTGSGNSPDDAAVVRFDPNGVATDFFLFDGIGLGNDQALAITTDFQNQVYVTFRTDVDPTPALANYNYLTIKFDNNLNQLWLNPPMYNGPLNSDDIPVAITVNASGNTFVTGYSKSDTLNGRTNIDWVTIRYDSLGIQSDLESFDGALGGDDEPNAVALKANSLWITGFSVGNGNNQKDLTTLRYDLAVGFGENPSPVVNSVIYPNPFNDNAVLKVDAGSDSQLILRIFDTLGQELKTVAMKDDTYQLDRSNLVNGIYFYQISNEAGIISNGNFIIE